MKYLLRILGVILSILMGVSFAKLVDYPILAIIATIVLAMIISFIINYYTGK